MVDKVKVLVGQRDSEELQLSEEIKPSSDYMSTKGLAFEGSDNYLLEKIGKIIKCKTPSHSVKPIYSSDNIMAMEYFDGFTQVEVNRIGRIDISYSNDLVTSESIKVYDSDGTSILSTTIVAYSYTNDVVTNIQVTEV